MKVIMKSCLVIFSIISILLFTKCSNDPIAEYYLHHFQDNLRIDSGDTIQINMCDIIEAKWDSILVIKPYTPVSKQSVLRELKNYRNIKSRIKDIRQTDFYSYLVFIRDHKAIGFSRVYHGPVDFANLPVTDDRSPSVTVVSKTNCARLFMKKCGGLFIVK